MAEEVTEEQPKKSGGKGLMIVLIVLIVVLLLAVVGGGYFLYSQGVFSPKDDKQTEVVQKEESSGKERFKAAVDDLVLNITNAKGREKLMKLSFTLKSSDPAIEAIVEEYKAEIVDVVIAQISDHRMNATGLHVPGRNIPAG